MKRTFLFMTMLMLVAIEPTFAQQWGSGIWGGQQGCGFDQRAPEGAYDKSDETDEIEKQIALKKKEKAELDRKMSRLKSDLQKAKRAVDKRLNSDVASQVFEHMDRPTLSALSYSCLPGSQGDQNTVPDPVIGDATDGVSGTPGEAPTATPAATIRLTGAPFCGRNGTNYWAKYALAGGQVRDSICDVKVWTKATADSFDCKQGLQDYLDAKTEMEETREKLNGVKSDLKTWERELSDTRSRLSELRLKEETEGGYCATCHSGRRGAYKPSGWQVAGSLALAALGGAGAYLGANHAIDQAAKIGWPTSPYYPAMATYPYVMAGIYGTMLGGGMGGGFGCSPMFGGPMGGAFGGMPGLYGGLGLPGMYGGMPMAMPMMMPMAGGMMFAGGGVFMGMPMMGGYPMSMGYPMAMGYPMSMPMMMPMAMPMAMPMMMPMAGGMMFAGGGVFMGMPMGMPMAMPMMMPMSMPMMTPMMMPMAMPMMTPMMMPMMGGGMGMPMMMPMMGGMGMQNMMMQQYYAQMQMQMQMQQAQMSDQMMRMQTVGYLSGEMQRLQQQIYMISTGMGGTYSVMPMMGGYGGMPSVIPYPGGGGYYGTATGGYAPPVIPYPGTTGTGGYPGYGAPIR